MKFKDYYEVLNVAKSATDVEVKAAYRKLARKYHPDVSKDPNAEDKFKELGEAYAVLKDPEKRAAYDQVGTGSKHGQEFTPPPNWDAGFEFSGNGFGNNSNTYNSEFFEEIFGRQARNQQNQNNHAKGQDHHAKVMIDLGDSYSGAKKSISLKLPVQDGSGRMGMQDRTLDVTIPKGIYAGQHLRLSGQGSPAMGTGNAGDLYLEIAFKPNVRYRTEGRDVYMDLPVTPWEAALGATISLPTPDGSVELKIPLGSNSNRKLRLRKRGIPGVEPGDLYVVTTIVTPPADTEEEKAAYIAMANAFHFDPRLHFQEKV
ncbi:DnaJ C-terminal domain-containing protein [Methylophilus flavus]|uniref:DnaJ C-terminal domain-containing protein n=1 Tax=Methylophilus flavus TaxID=640084 RepID=A0ABW3PBE7_9PROT